MIILEKPYVSEFLKAEILSNGWPVLDTPMARQVFGPHASVLCGDAEFATRFSDGARLYSNSENALGWVEAHLAGSDLPRMAALCKDKVRFREAIRGMFPDFSFQGVDYDALATLDPAGLPMPCIIKPAVGFFSMGVHRVDTVDEWQPTLDTIAQELQTVRGIYPEAVMDGSRFIIEACIEGEEYAVDAYFDSGGEPVVLNILHHVFATGKDVSDRVYSTSATIVRQWLEPFTEFLREMGRLTELRDFPVHVELRVEAHGPHAGRAVPIEVNPLRFAGWCTTDVAWHAWGISPYAHYLQNRRPDWKRLTQERTCRLWSIAIAELPAGLHGNDVQAVDCTGLAAQFERVCETRCIDWREYPVMAILFPETREGNEAELDRFLRADLRPFALRS